MKTLSTINFISLFFSELLLLFFMKTDNPLFFIGLLISACILIVSFIEILRIDLLNIDGYVIGSVGIFIGISSGVSFFIDRDLLSGGGMLFFLIGAIIVYKSLPWSKKKYKNTV